MVADKKTLIMSSIFVTCLVLAIVVMIVTSSGGGSSSPDKPVLMRCTECNAEFEMEPDEYIKQIEKQSEMLSRITFTCPECGKQSACPVDR